MPIQKLIVVYASNDVVQPKDGPFWRKDDE